MPHLFFLFLRKQIADLSEELKDVAAPNISSSLKLHQKITSDSASYPSTVLYRAATVPPAHFSLTNLSRKQANHAEMDTSGRKRKSRFSDAVQRSDAPVAPVPAAGAAHLTGAPVDAAALAKAAAEKIARAIPGGLAVAPATAAAAPTGRANGDVDEQIRLTEEKRRRTDQIYQSVQQQMSHIKSLLGKPGSAAAAGPTTTTSTFMPAPLLLDEHGRQIDATGKVIEEAVGAPVATLKANQSGSVARTSSSSSTKAPSKQNLNPYLSHRTVDKEDAVDAVDPRLSIKKRETYAWACVFDLLMGCDVFLFCEPLC